MIGYAYNNPQSFSLGYSGGMKVIGNPGNQECLHGISIQGQSRVCNVGSTGLLDLMDTPATSTWCPGSSVSAFARRNTPGEPTALSEQSDS